MIVRCPRCGQDSLFSPENPFRPFCSERCKIIDLGAWADGSYKIPVQSSNPDEDENFESELEKSADEDSED